MPDTPKHAGAPCPSCNADRPGEFKRKAENFTRWACLCGASGVITFSKPAAQPKGPTLHKHWRAGLETSPSHSLQGGGSPGGLAAGAFSSDGRAAHGREICLREPRNATQFFCGGLRA